MRVPDLSPSLYQGQKDRPVLVVGLLTFGDSDFTAGEHDPDFLAELERHCRRPITPRRSLHVCMICGNSYSEYADLYGYERAGVHTYQGNADILVQAPSGTVYAAPIQIFHYVRDHRYRPPQEFIDAVVSGDATDMRWYARD